MATQTIDSTLITSAHPDITKRTSVSGLMLSLFMLVAGVLMFASVFGMNDKSSAVSMALMVSGVALILFGVFRLFWRTQVIVYLPTGSLAKERSLYFDLKNLENLTGMLERKSLDYDTEIKCGASGNVRMDILISEDNKFAAVQLFQFVPYTYTPVTSICYFTDTEAAAVSAFLSKCKAA